MPSSSSFRPRREVLGTQTRKWSEEPRRSPDFEKNPSLQDEAKRLQQKLSARNLTNDTEPGRKRDVAREKQFAQRKQLRERRIADVQRQWEDHKEYTDTGGRKRPYRRVRQPTITSSDDWWGAGFFTNEAVEDDDVMAPTSSPFCAGLICCT